MAGNPVVSELRAGVKKQLILGITWWPDGMKFNSLGGKLSEKNKPGSFQEQTRLHKGPSTYWEL